MKALAGLLTIAMLLLTGVMYGQGINPLIGISEYNFYGSGARAFAMGNAFVGLADDVTGGSWNPAGIWEIESPMLAASYLHYAPNGKFIDSKTPEATNNRLNIKSLGSFSFVTPLRIKGHPWVFDFNYVRNNEFVNEMNLYSGVESEPEINPDITLLEKGHMKSYRFGLTTRLYKQLSGGFTVNIYDARRYFEGRQTQAWVDMRYEIPPVPDSLMLFSSQIDSTSSSGVNFTVGFMYKMEKYSAGAVVHTPFTIKHNSDSKREQILIRNGLRDDNISGAIFVDDSLTKQDLPLTVALGFAFFPTEKLTVTMDMNYQNYKPVKLYTLDSFNIDASGERTDSYSEHELQWNNTVGIGGGMEYMMDSKFGRIPLRCGFRFDQWPQPKDRFSDSEIILDEDEEFVGVRTINSYSGRQSSVAFGLGSGIHWSQVELDFAWRYQTGVKWNFIGRIEGFEDDSYEWERKEHEFKVTFIGHFQ
jgi:long-chain fatty acid transport protein